MNFLEKLNFMMEKMSINKSKLSQISGVPYTTIDGFYKKGYENTKISTIRKIAVALNVSLDYLVDDDILDESYQPPKVKKAPSISDEAHKFAKDYDKLTDHGKGAVKAILSYEEKAASGYSQQQADDGKIITLPKSQKNSSGLIEIKVYDEPAAAGLGNYLDEPEYRVEQYPEYAIPDKTDFGVLIDGDSMEPKIHNGGTVFVEAKVAIDPGQIGIFVLDGKVYCKKLVVDHENREIRLMSLNPKYEDIPIGEYVYFRTLGRVLGQWTPGQNNDDVFGW